MMDVCVCGLTRLLGYPLLLRLQIQIYSKRKRNINIDVNRNRTSVLPPNLHYASVHSIHVMHASTQGIHQGGVRSQVCIHSKGTDLLFEDGRACCLKVRPWTLRTPFGSSTTSQQKKVLALPNPRLFWLVHRLR